MGFSSQTARSMGSRNDRIFATGQAQKAPEEIRPILGHMTDEVRAALAKLRMSTSFITEDCTGYVQLLIKKATDRHREIHAREYETGKYKDVGKRTIPLTRLVAEALTEFMSSTRTQSLRHFGWSD